MMLVRRMLAVGVVLLATLATLAPAAMADTTLRLDGIGPLTLGMGRSAAVDTGWLSNPSKGCPLQSPPATVYRLLGRQAPKGIRAFAEFNDGKLTSISASKGVKTSIGVRVGHTTAAGMTRAYRRKGFKVKTESSSMFGGTFVTVFNGGGDAVIGGFAIGGTRLTTLAIPRVQVCE